MHPLRAMFLTFLVASSMFAAETSRVTPDSFTSAKQPRIAVSATGKYHVVFGQANEIFVSSSSDSGRTFRAPVRVGTLEKLALGMRRGPRISVTTNSLIVTAISHSSGNLLAWRSQDEGVSWFGPVAVNNVPTSAREGLHDLASDGLSKSILVWLDLRNGKTELWSSVSDDGGATWAANRRIYKSPDESICECCHPSVIFHNREIVVMWRNWLEGSRDMYKATSSDGGIIFSQASRIGDATWKLNACPMDGGSLASNGKTVCYAWRRENTIYTTEDGLLPIMPTGRGTQPVVIRHRDGFATVWQDRGKLHWSAATDLPLSENAGFAASVWNEREQRSALVYEGADGIYLGILPAN